MTRVLATLLVLAGLSVASAAGTSPDPKALEIPAQDVSKARELVKRLGSEVYREREDAHAELAKMGRTARPALLEGAASDADPEVRYRCSRLLPKAGADDLKARLDTFLADADGKYEHDLPGLKQYRKHLGAEKETRNLFVEIVKSPYNVELLQAIEKSSADTGRAIADRRTTLWSMLQQRNFGGRVMQPQQIPLSDIACLLFAESLVPSKDIPRTGMFSYVTGVNFLQQQSSMTALNGNNNDGATVAFKKIVGKWLDGREDVQDLNQLPYLVGQQLKGFPQSIPLLRKIVTTDGVQGPAKGQALMFLTQQKGKEEIPFLKTLLTNDSLVATVWFGNNQPIQPNQQPQQHQCLLKDVALAHLLMQTGQKMEDYGYKFPPGVVPQQNQIGYGNYAFETEEKRRGAMVKFGFWHLKYGPNGPSKKDEPKKDDPKPVPPLAPGPMKR